MISLSKTMDPNDLLSLPLAQVDEHFRKEAVQAEQRRWEYGMALLAAKEWTKRGPVGTIVAGRALDVGGAGSPLPHMLAAAGWFTTIVDPVLNHTLQEAVQYVGGLSDFHLVTCISVLEHIPLPEFDQFHQDLARVVAPGGLLFLTMDIWNEPPAVPDTAHFSHMRTHIYTLATWRALAETFSALGFDLFGGQDWEYHGHQLYGSYSFCSLALVKRQ